jgi:hypothetical protein
MVTGSPDVRNQHIVAGGATVSATTDHDERLDDGRGPSPAVRRTIGGGTR